jgi:predicted DNA-binding protein (MmcQ/YjbR family)
VSCILNALEGMDDEHVSQDLRQDFLDTFQSKLSLQFEDDEIETSQGRLWYLYTCSAEVKDDKVLPLHVSKERLMKQRSQSGLYGAAYSPVSVNMD